jgi:phosphatidylethanolamine-binding protein (PEBP) family uncharacterized protein
MRQQRTFRRHTRKRCKGVGGASFNVRYNAVPVRGQQFTRQQTAVMPRISVPRADVYYTLIMYDNDTRDPAYVHWYVPNIVRGAMHPVLPYQPPNPPRDDTHYHVYTIDLYRQPGLLDEGSVLRTGFDVDAFAHARRLVHVGRRQYYVVPDRI